MIFVHGLVSSPRAWVKTINELENTPLIDSRYQFWVFLYPTGLPIPSSARRLRESLVRVRNVVDPSRSDPALDHTVLVGHSMGGVLSKMMAQETGTTLWNAAITVPPERFRAPPELARVADRDAGLRARAVREQAGLHRHASSRQPDRERAGRMGGERPDAQADGASRADRRDRGLERPERAHARAQSEPAQLDQQLEDRQSDSGCSGPDSDRSHRFPITRSSRGKRRNADSDGVVDYVSSHLEGAESEKIVTGDHSSQETPEVTGEIRRILTEHLEKLPFQVTARIDETVRLAKARAER